MKGVPIKFRGADIGGHYVYGLLTMKKIRNSGKLSYAIANGNFTQGETIPVSEDSIAQLVGFDADGNEVYEGDKIQDLATGDFITAKLCPCNSYEIGITTAYFKKVGNNND